MNRKERRAAMRQEISKHKSMMAQLSREQRIEKLIRNGITLEDLRNEYRRGHEDGMKESGVSIVKACYAGICIALHDEFGFGQERCIRALKAVDGKTLWALNHFELVDEVFRKTGIRMDFNDAFDRIGRADPPTEPGRKGVGV